MRGGGQQTGFERETETEKEKDRKTERQKDRKTERQKDRKTERQILRVKAIDRLYVNEVLSIFIYMSIEYTIKLKYTLFICQDCGF